MCSPDPTQDFVSGSAAALVFLLWEVAITFDDEVELIWSKPSSVWIKWVFLFIRYFSIVLQIISHSFEISVTTRMNVNSDMIRVWYGIEVVAAHLVMVCVEIVMMARVYALYQRNRRVGALFSFLLMVEGTVVVATTVANFPKRSFDVNLIVSCIPRSFAWYGIVVVVTQITILLLSMLKYLRGTWKGEPIVVVMFRDGTIAFSAICLISLITVIYVLAGWDFSFSLYPWFLSFVAAAGGRIIINMQKIPIHTNVERGVLTTMDFSVHDSETHLFGQLTLQGQSSMYIDSES